MIKRGPKHRICGFPNLRCLQVNLEGAQLPRADLSGANATDGNLINASAGTAVQGKVVFELCTAPFYLFCECHLYFLKRRRTQ